jgi:hypothetical protein
MVAYLEVPDFKFGLDTHYSDFFFLREMQGKVSKLAVATSTSASVHSSPVILPFSTV